MATATATKTKTTSTKSTPKAGTKASIEASATTPTKTKAKGPAKPQAVADDIDLATAVDASELKPAPRQSKWLTLLDKLYDATVADKVPRGDDGSLRFIKLGSFTNINGARTQARALEKKGLGETYEFKTLTLADKGGSELWGRVIEVDA